MHQLSANPTSSKSSHDTALNVSNCAHGFALDDAVIKAIRQRASQVPVAQLRNRVLGGNDFASPWRGGDDGQMGNGLVLQHTSTQMGATLD
ncbi:hypothetical protein Vi05172_g11652 [Venturia inaequalis]|nr:hypothetical protein Vi05172_g11652 [Venturia inaequalis]